jgi:hypothetical protein
LAACRLASRASAVGYFVEVPLPQKYAGLELPAQNDTKRRSYGGLEFRKFI